MADPLDLPEAPTTTPTGLTVGISSSQRLEMSMRLAADTGNPDATFPADRWSYQGVPNPYGRGVAAFEPHSIIFDAYKDAYDDSTSTEAARLDTAAHDAFNVSTPLVQGDGQVASFIDAAMTLASRRVPYVWGGVSANGVDCSGLIAYAARAAGIQLNGAQWPRYRAVDYGRMGVAVTLADARPGDIAYFDNPGDVDHVGIYIGNGQIIQAPQSGDVVRVSNIGRVTSIRRIFDDTQFGQIEVGPGEAAVSYNGQPYNPVASGGSGSTITRAPTSGNPYPLPTAPTFGQVSPNGRYYAPAPVRTYRGTR